MFTIHKPQARSSSPDNERGIAVNQSIQLNELLPALIKAKKAFSKVVKSKQGYNFKYADGEVIQEATNQALLENNLVLLHTLDGEYLNTSLLHATSGQMLVSRLRINITQDEQDLGASITYFKRYNACALLDIYGDDDLDAKQQPKQKPPQTQGVEIKSKPATHTEAKPPVTNAAPVLKAVGEIVLSDGEFKGMKISEVWAKKRIGALAYATKIIEYCKAGNKPAEVQLKFVDYGKLSGYYSEVQR